MRKGIVLAGGTGSRLFPATLAASKQLLPVYDKPMVYYPLSALMLAGIRQILLISGPREILLFERLLGNGSHLGLAIEYAVQDEPRGIADAFRVGRDFIGENTVALVLGDNLIYGHGLGEILAEASKIETGAVIFPYTVSDPERYGVVEMDGSKPLRIVEKPEAPKSNWAVPGLYFYDNNVVELASTLRPSSRGELEITDVNNIYIERGQMTAFTLGRGFAWLDAGTEDALLQASNFVAAIETRQGMKIACLEEIAWRKGFIDKGQLIERGTMLRASSYGKYLLSLVS